MEKKIKYKYRKPELEQYKSLWITKEVYEVLRNEKKKQNISLAKIVCNLVLEKYNKK